MNERAPNTFRLAILAADTWVPLSEQSNNLKQIEDAYAVHKNLGDKVRIESCYIPPSTEWEVYDPNDDVKRAYR